MTKKALITGVTGQDGAYLSKHLLENNYKVYGGIRRTSTIADWRLRELGIVDEIEFVDFDLLEQSNITSVVQSLQPDEVYNLAAQSFVSTSFTQPAFTAQADGIGVLYILEAIRQFSSHTRFYQASSSELFGKVQAVPQDENTPFHPRSPYGVAKLYGHWITINYRESYDLYACAGILFNHESPLRGLEFVTRKITDGLARIKFGRQNVLRLGNLDALRDWGFAGDYIVAMHKMLQNEAGEEFTISTGEMHSVREFCELAAQAADMEVEWQGEGAETKGIDKKTGKEIICVDPKFYRPAEVDQLLGNSKKAQDKLGWRPETSFAELVEMMTKADIDRIGRLD